MTDATFLELAADPLRKAIDASGSCDFYSPGSPRDLAQAELERALDRIGDLLALPERAVRLDDPDNPEWTARDFIEAKLSASTSLGPL